MHFFQAVLFMANEISDKCTFVLISRNQLKRKSSQILITDYATCQINYSHIQWDYVTLPHLALLCVYKLQDALIKRSELTA